MQMKCVSNSWNTLISNPKFVKIHLNRSARNPYFSSLAFTPQLDDYIFTHFPVSSLLQNLRITIPRNRYYRLNNKDCSKIVGSCNGLICLLGYSYNATISVNYKNVWFRFWNPATRKISDKLGSMSCSRDCIFVFCYNNSTDIYKLVELSSSGNNDPQTKTKVRVFSLEDNVWRTIQSFPVVPLQLLNSTGFDSVHLNCTVNWLANQSDRWNDSTRECVILSFDLATEKYTQFMPPKGFDSFGLPSICALKDSLCLYHNFKNTDLVIWKMIEFGDENSWTQFHKVSYHNIPKNYKQGGSLLIRLIPLHLSENGETMVLADMIQNRVILYNLRTNRAKKTRINRKICWSSMKDYVESLVSTS